MAREAYDDSCGDMALFFSPRFSEERVWHAEELGAILEHQWNAPLNADLASQHVAAARRLALLCEADQLLIKSYRDVLTHRMPPIELLEMIKSFAQKSLAHPDAELPSEIAKVLYVLSIAVARLRCGVTITKLRDEEVRRNIEAALSQPWLTQQVASILCEALDEYGGGDEAEGQVGLRGD